MKEKPIWDFKLPLTLKVRMFNFQVWSVAVVAMLSVTVNTPGIPAVLVPWSLNLSV